FPQISDGNVAWALWEPGAGVLMARRAVEAAVNDAVQLGVEYRAAAIEPPLTSFPGAALQCSIASLASSAGDRISAGAFVFCGGPWVPEMVPLVTGPRMFHTRHVVLFFRSASGH